MKNNNPNHKNEFPSMQAKTSVMYLLENNIVLAEEMGGIDVVFEDAILNLEVANKIHSLGPWAILVDSRKTKSMDKEARDYYAQKENLPDCVAMAILVDSYFSKVLANFFIGFSKPKMPTRLFTSKEEAIEWLNEKLNENATIVTS